MLPPQKFAP